MKTRIFLLCLAPALSWANTDCGSSACSQLEEVVVTGTRYNVRLMESPVSISVLTEEQLRWSVAHSAAELLRDLPGITVSDAGQPGLKRIRLRGEESEVFFNHTGAPGDGRDRHFDSQRMI